MAMGTDNTNILKNTKLEFVQPLANYSLQEETNTFTVCNESQVFNKVTGNEEQKKK